MRFKPTTTFRAELHQTTNLVVLRDFLTDSVMGSVQLEYLSALTGTSSVQHFNEANADIRATDARQLVAILTDLSPALGEWATEELKTFTVHHVYERLLAGVGVVDKEKAGR